MTKHTPGKWRAEITRASYIVVAGDRVIALIEGDDEQHEANAHLVALAPTMAEWIRWLRSAMPEGQYPNDVTIHGLGLNELIAEIGGDL